MYDIDNILHYFTINENTHDILKGCQRCLDRAGGDIFILCIKATILYHSQLRIFWILESVEIFSCHSLIVKASTATRGCATWSAPGTRQQAHGPHLTTINCLIVSKAAFHAHFRAFVGVYICKLRPIGAAFNLQGGWHSWICLWL